MELKKSEIKFTVELDEKNLPKKIKWNASDANFDGEKECNSMLISVWDKADKVTMGIDLWTNEMMIDEMNVFFHQTLKRMSETYLRSTSNNEISKMISEFSDRFAEKIDTEKPGHL